ncbi:MAG: class I SAM-dependent methyltransferase [Nitrospiria bacterium]
MDPKIELVNRFFSGTGATYDFMVKFSTFGIDQRWKKRIVDLIPPDSKRVLDLACGTGISTLAIANRYPDCEIIGVELREEYLEIARRKIRERKIKNIQFVLSRAEDYRSNQPFDCITSSYLAKYADLKSLTEESRKMLKENGLLLMHDFIFPPKLFLVWVWRLYFLVLQRAGGFFFKSWREIYYGLPKLIEKSLWMEELLKALKQQTFRNIEIKYLTAYGSAIITGIK